MDELLLSVLQNLPILILFLIILGTLLLLGKGADLLVEEAVSLSVRWKIPKVFIGATIVSLGTTLPEASVSVLAAIQGEPGLALGNAVGSIICDTGLIIGIAALINPLPLNKKMVNRQGWLQLGSGLLLVLAALPYGRLFGRPGASAVGSVSQTMGFVFVALLILYMFISIRWSKQEGMEIPEAEEELKASPLPLTLLKFVLGVAMIIIASKVLIPSVHITAVRVGIPQSIIAATLVAFGTSLPELVTAITASRKGHGELAIGNIIGADILNVLFVTGLSAAVTPGGLAVPVQFYWLQFPAMILILGIFKAITHFEKTAIKRPYGLLLLILYAAYTVLSYLLKG